MPEAAAPVAPAAPAAAPTPSPSTPTPSAAPKGFTVSQFRENAQGVAPTPEPAPAPQSPAEKLLGYVPELGADEEPVALEEGDEDDALEPGADADPWAEQIHGMTAKDLLEAIKAGTLPEGLLDALQHEYGDEDDRQSISLREALDQSSKERMQLRDYHRQLHDVRVKERDLISMAEGIQASISGLNSRATLVDDLQALGVTDEVLDGALEDYARRKVEYRKLPQHMKDILDGQKRDRLEAANLRKELNQLKQRDRVGQEAQVVQQNRAVVQKHGPAVFLRNGLNPKSGFAQEKFRHFLGLIADGKPYTREHVEQAALAAKQDIHSIQKRDKQPDPSKRQPQGRPLSVSRAASPQTLSVPRQAPKQKGFTPSQLAERARG
jgi:hypothetical protein